MAGLKRRILGLTVISVGVCAALPFRHEKIDSPLNTRPAKLQDEALGPHTDLTLQLTIPTAIEAPSTIVDEQQTASVATSHQPTSQPHEVRREDLEAPPQLAPAFEPFIATFPVRTKGETQPEASDNLRRVHRIADGDTLESLAERYLGDRSAWQSIFDANGGKLASADLLPIGEEIVIPREVHASHGVSDDGLVPIPAELLNRE
ncbi:MAG: LysM peptidoglycan-binding domain-containing protein [Planctomycetes bacterium]|nr:LysM peptidoglycan-binding domain-containing protein [Planctomycetota bacterium]